MIHTFLCFPSLPRNKLQKRGKEEIKTSRKQGFSILVLNIGGIKGDITKYISLYR